MIYTELQIYSSRKESYSSRIGGHRKERTELQMVAD